MMKTPRSILYIDDDAGMRRLVQKLLERRGHDIVVVGTGAEGVEQVKARRFDIVAIDHFMPGMDGLQTMAALQAIPDCPPVVYVTGSQDVSVAIGALKAGAYEYVVKTVGDDFVDLMEQAFTLTLARVRLERERDEAEEKLKEANDRLGVLLKEVNHRVANSLQLVSAMVTMQSRSLSDERAIEALDDTNRRIQAIAQVHRSLYTSDDVESVSIDEYLAAIIAELEESWSTPEAPRHIRLEADPVRLKTDKAVNLGVIVNELVSNSCKYAYPEDQSGEIRVAFRSSGENAYQLVIEDDGCGMSPDEAPKGTGLGSKLIQAMASSLKGKVEYDQAHQGCRATVTGTI